jgi:hypothetical protein
MSPDVRIGRENSNALKMPPGLNHRQTFQNLEAGYFGLFWIIRKKNWIFFGLFKEKFGRFKRLF